MGYKMDICQVAALRIRKMRLEKNMTIDDLAEKCDVSTQTIKLIEAGRRNFKIKTLYTIANSLNVSSDYLIGRIDSSQDTTNPVHLFECKKKMSSYIRR